MSKRKVSSVWGSVFGGIGLGIVCYVVVLLVSYIVGV